MTSTFHLRFSELFNTSWYAPKTTIRTNKNFKKEDLPASSIAVTKLCSLARPHCVPRMLMVSPSSMCQDSNQKKINTMSTECLICSPFRLPIIHILYILTYTICWKALHSLYTIRRSRMNNISYGHEETKTVARSICVQQKWHSSF